MATRSLLKYESTSNPMKERNDRNGQSKYSSLDIGEIEKKVQKIES